MSGGHLRVVRTLPPPVANPAHSSWRCGTCGRIGNGDGRHACWTFRLFAAFATVVTIGQIAFLAFSLMR